jgi:hypothetical protein
LKNALVFLVQNNVKSSAAPSAQSSQQQNGNNAASAPQMNGGPTNPQMGGAGASPSFQRISGANAPSVNNVCFSTNPCYGNAKCVSKVGMMNDCSGAVNGGTSQSKTYISLEEF